MVECIIGGIVATQIHNLNKVEKINEKALKKNIKAFTKEAEANQMIDNYSKKMEMSFQRLALRKKGILATSMKKFLDVYKKLIKINWTDGDGIKELVNNNPLSIQAMDLSVSMASTQLTKTEMICRYVTAPFFVDEVMEAERNYHLSRKRYSYANVAYEEAKLVSVALEGVAKRADLMTDVITKLNVFLGRSLINTEELIEERGYQHLYYSENDKKQLMTCINLATSVKQIIDVPILDENDELTRESMELIDMGNALCEKLKQMSL